MNGLRAGLLVLLVVTGSTAIANGPVQAVGLFKDRAMIRVLGKEHYLTVGQASPEGATLIESDSTHAVVRYKDETYRLTLTEQVVGGFKKPTDVNLSIPPDSLGQYRIQGSINGFAVGFRVDTGASLVALSERQAKEMGIDYSSSTHAPVVTAQGRRVSKMVELDSVVVGGIQTRAARRGIPGNYPSRYYRHVIPEQSENGTAGRRARLKQARGRRLLSSSIPPFSTKYTTSRGGRYPRRSASNPSSSRSEA
jgi:aspartyl protease family protein